MCVRISFIVNDAFFELHNTDKFDKKRREKSSKHCKFWSPSSKSMHSYGFGVMTSQIKRTAISTKSTLTSRIHLLSFRLDYPLTCISININIPLPVLKCKVQQQFECDQKIKHTEKIKLFIAADKISHSNAFAYSKSKS